jgi:hypothetical protein
MYKASNCACCSLWVKEDEMGSACSMHGAKKNAYRVLVGMLEENRPLK